jgi:hypothetical protein
VLSTVGAVSAVRTVLPPVSAMHFATLGGGTRKEGKMELCGVVGTRGLVES